MGYHPRIECKKIATFQTTRSRSSELWFVNNVELEQDILGYAAKYSERYRVRLYAFAIEGSHIHFPALFPKANRAHFMRDFNSSVARAVPRRQASHPGGRFWARRYSGEYLPGAKDIEEQFFYTVLQPVQDGLVTDIAAYPGYNCFEDAITGTVRKYPVVNWKAYHDARRWNQKVQIEDFTQLHELRYTRLPGYSHLSRTAYVKLMREKLKLRTEALLKKLLRTPQHPQQNIEYMKLRATRRLQRVVPGSLPKRTKVSSRYSHRPRVLSKNNARRAQAKAWYFSIYFSFKEASARYRAGDLRSVFPQGTYRPPAFTVGYQLKIGELVGG